MNNSLEDWLEWADARGGTLEEAGFREWLSELIRKGREEAWDEGFSLATRNTIHNPHPMAEMNPYRKE